MADGFQGAGRPPLTPEVRQNYTKADDADDVSPLYSSFAQRGVKRGKKEKEGD